MILYTENPKDSTQKLINEFSKVAGYMINTQKLITFFYINNEISERECKKTTPFKIAPLPTTKPRNKPDQGKTDVLKTTKHL